MRVHGIKCPSVEWWQERGWWWASQKVHFERTLWQAAMHKLSIFVYYGWCSPMANSNAPGDSSIQRINAAFFFFLAVFSVNTIGRCTTRTSHKVSPNPLGPRQFVMSLYGDLFGNSVSLLILPLDGLIGIILY